MRLKLLMIGLLATPLLMQPALAQRGDFQGRDSDRNSSSQYRERDSERRDFRHHGRSPWAHCRPWDERCIRDARRRMRDRDDRGRSRGRGEERSQGGYGDSGAGSYGGSRGGSRY